MLTPEEVTLFFQGESAATIELTYGGSQAVVRLTCISPRHVIAYIPRVVLYREAVFNIEAALSDELCGAVFSKSESEYLVNIVRRSQVWSVMKIAANHLGWCNEKLLSHRFTKSTGGI
jgi:hypothetical protein